MLTASANTAYGPGVTLKDVERFQEKNPLNSRVVKENGKLVEQIFRAATRAWPPGLYAEELSRVNAHLAEAMKSANAKQKPVLAKLIRYFQTGSPKDWEAYNIAWLKVGLGGGRQHRLHRDVRGSARAEGPVGGPHQLPQRRREPDHGAHRQEGPVLRGPDALAGRLQAQEGDAAGGQGGGLRRHPPAIRPPASTCPTSRTSARSTAARASSSPTSWTRPRRCGGCRWRSSSPSRPRIAPRPRSTPSPRASGSSPSTRCSATPRGRWTRRSSASSCPRTTSRSTTTRWRRPARISWRSGTPSIRRSRSCLRTR